MSPSTSDRELASTSEPSAAGFAAARAILAPADEQAEVALSPVVESGPPGPATHPLPSAIHGRGDLHVADGADVGGSLSCDADLFIGRGAHLHSDVSSAGNVEVRDGARIDGELLVEGALTWAPSARAACVAVEGGFRTQDGAMRARRLIARQGIQPGGRPRGGEAP